MNDCEFSLLDQLPVGACVVDQNLRVVLWNRRLHDWSGIPASDIVGQEITDSIPRLEHPRYLRRLRSVVDGGPPALFSAQLHGHVIPCPLPSGKLRIQSTTVMHLAPTAKRCPCALIIVEDVTDLSERIQAHEQARAQVMAELEERRRTEARLRGASRALEQSNQRLEEFASIVAHDLKAPLRHIMGFARILQEEQTEAGAPVNPALARILYAGDRMARLISGVLAYSRLSTRDGQLAHCDLADFAADVATDMEQELAAAGAEVMIDTGGLSVLAEETQLRQLFQNLFSNSLKFRKPDVPLQVHVTATLESALDDAAEDLVVHLVVRDNGIGFDSRYATDIFRMCRRLHTEREYEGSGVGLAIVARVAECHGAAVRAVGEPGVGAEFHFAWPTHMPLSRVRPDEVPFTDAPPGMGHEECA